MPATDSPSDAPVVGIDLGGTNMAVAVVDPRGKVLGRSKRKTRAAEGRDVVIDRMCEAIERACTEAGVERRDLGGVGIGAPSAIDIDKGLVLSSGNLGWKNVPLRDIMEERLRLPVRLDNDVNMAAWGEATLGACAGRGDMLAVWVGTGIGGGLILNGRLWRGPCFTAGEIGQTILFPNCSPGHQTLEEHCSRVGMVRSIETLIGFYPQSMLKKSLTRTAEEGPLGSGPIAEAYANGDELAVRVVESAADLLGVAIANFLTVLSLANVVIGGGVGQALSKPYMERIRRSFERHVYPASLRKCDFHLTELGDDAGVLGAAMLVRESAVAVER